MSSLDPPMNFVAKRKGSSFLGADDDAESDYVVLTFSSAIALVHLMDDKVIKSWSCTRGRKNTATALFAPEEKEFVVVQNGNVLKTFSETDYENGDSFTLNHKVHCLVRCHNHNPLVMLGTGSLHRLHHVLENPRGIVPDSTIGVQMEEIIFTCSFVRNSDDILACTVCKVKQGYALLTSNICKEEDKITHHHAIIKHDASSLKACCAYHRTKTPLILTVWNDGSVCSLRPRLTHDGKLEIQIQKIVVLEVNENVSATSISEDQAAVSCIDSVVILDLKFGTVQCKTCINNSSAKLSAIRNHVILDMPGQLKKMPYSTRPVTLANVLLKQKADKAGNMHVCAKWSENPTQASLVNNKDDKLVDTLLKTEDELTFDKTWTKLWNGKSQRFREEFCMSGAMQNILSRFKSDKKESSFWPRSGLIKIISTGMINGRWCGGIIQHALDKQDWLLLLECLKNLNDIAEEMMVTCVTCLMGCQPSKLVNGRDGQDEDTTQPTVLCIDQLLQLPYSENALRKELASLSFDIVLKLVLHLTTLMRELSLASTAPSLEQVISWLSMLLDAHLSEIMVLEDSWPAIDQLYDAVKLQGSVFKELTSINKILLQIQSKLLKAKKPNNSLYSVEIMQF